MPTPSSRIIAACVRRIRISMTVVDAITPVMLSQGVERVTEWTSHDEVSGTTWTSSMLRKRRGVTRYLSLETLPSIWLRYVVPGLV